MQKELQGEVTSTITATSKHAYGYQPPIKLCLRIAQVESNAPTSTAQILLASTGKAKMRQWK